MSRRKHSTAKRREYFDELAARWAEWLTVRVSHRSSSSRYWTRGQS